MGDVPAAYALGGVKSVPMDLTLQQKIVAEVRSLDKRGRGLEPNPGSAA